MKRLLLLALGLAAACQSTLEVKVERVAFPPAPLVHAEKPTRYDRARLAEYQRQRAAYEAALATIASRRGTSVFDSVVRMTAVRAWTYQAADAIENALLAFENAQSDQAVPIEKDSANWAGTFRLNHTRFHRDCVMLREVGDRAGALLQAERLDDVFAAQAQVVALQAAQAARQIPYFLATSQPERIAAFENKASSETRLQIAPLMEQEARVLRPIVSAALRSVSAAGYGGFTMPDVFLIQPSDRLYEFVLKAPIDPQPLSIAKVDTTGDSSVVIVQESPGQFRVKRVASDPTTVLQNSAFIADMALRAAAQTITP